MDEQNIEEKKTVKQEADRPRERQKNAPRRQNRKRRSGRRISAQERKLILMIRMVLAALALVVILTVVMMIKAASQNPGEKQEPSQQEANSQGEQENGRTEDGNDEPVTITVSAVGDCTLGMDADFNYDTSFNAMYENVGDPAYFFQNVASVLANDDLTIANLEGTLTESEEIQEKAFNFKGDPEYANILAAGSVEAVNLANNHSYDYGESGFQDTIQNVENAGVTSFGYDRTALLDVKGIKVGLAGIYAVDNGMESETQVKQQVAQLKQQGAQLVIVSFHWGTESNNYAEETQRSLGHAAIDAGADLVVGHHPHVLQGIETYNGKKIVYSLGNFCFGGNSNPSDKDTMIFQQTFTIVDGQVAQDEVVQVIPCSISSTSEYNNYQPVIAGEDEKARIEGRIAEYSAAFSSEEQQMNSGDTDGSDQEGDSYE